MIDANETLRESGYDHDEMLSMNVADFEVGFDEEFSEGWTGMSEDRPLKVEGTHRRKDDLTYPVEVWVSRNRHSEGDRFVAICRDVTDRRERERKLERHREFVESATDMITLIDSDGTIKYVSPAIERVLGWDPEELIGENGFEYVHPDDRDERTDDIEALVEGARVRLSWSSDSNVPTGVTVGSRPLHAICSMIRTSTGFFEQP